MEIEKEIMLIWLLTLAIGTVLCGAMIYDMTKFMGLGDEVATTDEYNTLFNESFSGHIVSIDKLYTVRDENGNERAFEWKWIDHVDAEGGI
jgi:hypothetical protein